MSLPTATRASSVLCCLLAVLSLGTAVLGQTTATPEGKTRTYYVAADEVNWDYAPSGRDEAMGHPFDAIAKGYTEPGPHRIGRVYKKAIYREYTDGSFSTLKTRAPEEQYLGLVGPILRGEVGDTIKVIFRNNGSHPFSMHPHGVLYQKDSEGADYNDGPAAPTRPMVACPQAQLTLIRGKYRSVRAPGRTIRARFLALPFACGRVAGHRIGPVRRDRHYAARHGASGWPPQGRGP